MHAVHMSAGELKSERSLSWNRLHSRDEAGQAKRLTDQEQKVALAARSATEQAVPVREPVWDDVTRAETLSEEWAAARGRLADSSRAHDWPRVFEVLGEFPDMVNCSRLSGVALYSPLHHAAWVGADPAVVERLIAYGAWRTLRTARGERPVDVAARRGRTHLLGVLAPVYRRRVAAEPLLELASPCVYFPVPGMYGGFLYKLQPAGKRSTLAVDSWCRVCGGSGQRHLVTATGSTLVEDGYM